jgi:hypothetical protein
MVHHPSPSPPPPACASAGTAADVLDTPGVLEKVVRIIARGHCIPARRYAPRLLLSLTHPSGGAAAAGREAICGHRGAVTALLAALWSPDPDVKASRRKVGKVLLSLSVHSAGAFGAAVWEQPGALAAAARLLSRANRTARWCAVSALAAAAERGEAGGMEAVAEAVARAAGRDSAVWKGLACAVAGGADDCEDGSSDGDSSDGDTDEDGSSSHGSSGGGGCGAACEAASDAASTCSGADDEAGSDGIRFVLCACDHCMCWFSCRPNAVLAVEALAEHGHHAGLCGAPGLLRALGELLRFDEGNAFDIDAALHVQLAAARALRALDHLTRLGGGQACAAVLREAEGVVGRLEAAVRGDGGAGLDEPLRQLAGQVAARLRHQQQQQQQQAQQQQQQPRDQPLGATSAASPSTPAPGQPRRSKKCAWCGKAAGQCGVRLRLCRGCHNVRWAWGLFERVLLCWQPVALPLLLRCVATTTAKASPNL